MMHLLRKGIVLRTGGWFILAIVLALVLHQPAAQAASAESKFYTAERYATALEKNPAHQKYRHHWLKCINAYLAVYRHDPHGPWAAAGLYHAALLYHGLYRHSYLQADKQGSVDLLEQVVNHYAKSRYNPKARAKLSEITGQPVAQAPAADSGLARRWFQKAEDLHRRIQENIKLQKRRDMWMACINAYRGAYEADPRGELAPDALQGLADAYQTLSRWSGDPADRQAAQKALAQLATEFPGKGKDAPSQTASTPPSSPPTSIAQVIEDSALQRHVIAPDVPVAGIARPAVVEGLRFWSNPRYTRVVIDADQNAAFSYHELRADQSRGKPQRIYVDVHNSSLSNDLQKEVPINDNLLSGARAGQYTQDTVRVVVDIKSAKTYKIFPLKNPFRIVLDIWGYAEGEEVASIDPQSTYRRPSAPGLPPSDIVRQLALGVRRVVIDPGHGGKDIGAPGYYKGVYEKDVVLAIAKRLAEMVRSEIKCEAVLTRSSDVYLSLEERTAIANTQNADLFISIHTNASPDKRAYGLETFILNLATDDDAIRVAAMENATSMKNISDLDSILKDLMQNAKVNESTRLATYVQQATFQRVKAKFSSTRNKGISKAPFYVLLGADMPSVLIETAFISNPRDCKRLTTPEYQDALCRGILEGIKRYMDETNPMAVWSPISGRTARDGG